jgi:ketosteroid isomerase-like protein
MPTKETLARFIARVESGAHTEAIEEHYAPNATMQENENSPRAGIDVLVQNERNALSKVASVKSTCIRPAFVNGDNVVIRWVFEFEYKDGRHMRLDEIAYQRWEDEKIVQEKFFYDPAQFRPN